MYIKIVVFAVYHYNFYQSEDEAEIKQPFEFYIVSIWLLFLSSLIVVNSFVSGLGCVSQEIRHTNAKRLSKQSQIFLEWFFLFLAFFELGLHVIGSMSRVSWNFIL